MLWGSSSRWRAVPNLGVAHCRMSGFVEGGVVTVGWTGMRLDRRLPLSTQARNHNHNHNRHRHERRSHDYAADDEPKVFATVFPVVV